MPTIYQDFTVSYSFSIHQERDIFGSNRRRFIEIISGVIDVNTARLLIVVEAQLLNDSKEFRTNLDTLVAELGEVLSSRSIRLHEVTGGEGCKNSRESFLAVLSGMQGNRIDKHSLVIGAGGGALLDMVGLATTLAHRGVRHIRVPTTVLSQSDSGVGVKNAVNFFNQKNYLGTFAPPAAVVNDVTLLRTLSERDWLAGVSESIKVALIKDAHFFAWLENASGMICARNEDAMEYLIYRCAELHSDHIGRGGDPFERRVSRPLDFGHWAAHKLEHLTRFTLRHGEAVAIGLALDVTYSMKAGYLAAGVWERIVQCIQGYKLPIFHEALGDEAAGVSEDLLRGLSEFQDHLGGELTVMLLRDIGDPFSVHEIDTGILSASIGILQQLARRS